MSGLRVADRRRNARRIPTLPPTTLAQTTLSGPSYIPPLPVSGPPDPWNGSPVSSTLSGSSAGEPSWNPAIAPQYGGPYPPALLIENAAGNGGPYLGNNFLLVTTGSPVLPQPSFCMYNPVARCEQLLPFSLDTRSDKL